MIIQPHRRKNRMASLTFTVRQITKEELSLLLVFACQGIAAETHPENYKDLDDKWRRIDAFINGDVEIDGTVCPPLDTKSLKAD